MKVKVAQSCLTLCDPTDYTVHGILQARILEWVAFPFSRGSSQARDQTQFSCISGGFFTNWAMTRVMEKYFYLGFSQFRPALATRLPLWDNAASLPSKAVLRSKLCRNQVSHFMGISSRLQIHQGCKGETKIPLLLVWGLWLWWQLLSVWEDFQD